ncbi:glycosyltransferase [Halobacterium yunchengense]|uniref:glycosyltransferase n=1 Tax=Halobacterium yunchengense TaxID=3108497 RepID=UPI0030090282
MTTEPSGRPPKVAVAHYCEGAGHATRMLAVVEELEAAGYDTVIAGGGPGVKFVEANGYTEYEPPDVDFVGDYQDGNLLAVLRNSAPAVYERVDRYRAWFDREVPALLVTDDISAAVAATLHGQRFVYVSHDPSGFYDTAVERAGAWVRNRLARRGAEQFLLPKVWDGAPTIPGAVEIPPMAQLATGEPADVDVLVVPSAFSVDPDELADRLEARGRSVTLVGGDDWETQESLQPFVAGADLVVCSGYSTVMECAVAGTACVVVPATSEQRGVVDALADTPGFYAADSIADVEALLDDAAPPEPRANGAARVAEVAATYLPEPDGGARADATGD